LTHSIARFVEKLRNVFLTHPVYMYACNSLESIRSTYIVNTFNNC